MKNFLQHYKIIINDLIEIHVMLVYSFNRIEPNNRERELK